MLDLERKFIPEDPRGGVSGWLVGEGGVGADQIWVVLLKVSWRIQLKLLSGQLLAF